MLVVTATPPVPNNPLAVVWASGAVLRVRLAEEYRRGSGQLRKHVFHLLAFSHQMRCQNDEVGTRSHGEKLVQCVYCTHFTEPSQHDAVKGALAFAIVNGKKGWA